MCLPCLFALWSIEKAITLVWSVWEIAHDVCIGKGVCTSLCALCLCVCVCKFTFIGYKTTSPAAFQNLHKCWYFISKSTCPFFLYMLNTICDLMPYYDPISIRYDTPRPNSDSFKVSLTLAQRSRVHFLFYTHTHRQTHSHTCIWRLKTTSCC